MALENELQIECSKLQSQMQKIQEEISKLEQENVSLAPLANARKTQLIQEAQTKFDTKQESDRQRVKSICRSMLSKVETLVDTFTEGESKEYAGKYEVKALESKLSEIYPSALVTNYQGMFWRDLDSEDEVYQLYLSLESRVTNLKQGNMAGSIFSSVTSLLEKASDVKGVGNKAVLIVLAVIGLSFFLSPFLFLTIFSVIGIASFIHGAYVSTIFRDLDSVKAFLNDTYDVDIFQEDKGNILDEVREYLKEVEATYIEDIDSREFVQPTQELADIDADVRSKVEQNEAMIQSKRLLLDNIVKQLQEKMAAYDKAVADRKTAVEKTKQEFLFTFDWKYEWCSKMFLGSTSEQKLYGATWLKANTLYYSKDLEYLQKFGLLVSYQCLIHMHPYYAFQIVLDYKYMGGLLQPFSFYPAAVFDMHVDSEGIADKIDKIGLAIQNRTSNILQSSASIEEFNQLMSTYGIGGECYAIVHIYGLNSISPVLAKLIKNGPRVGYFFKIYLTYEELQASFASIPFQDIKEYGEVSEKLDVRTATQVKRLFTKEK